ncbi:MAG TPA: histidine phosphatase family protein [Acidimicrobiia bacterium]|nr:histidine phosphatase family protein [Acidimicrobiia bacterium]
MGMHRLFVLRHAKSSWNNAHQADFDRPLAPRGEKAAEALAEHIGGWDEAPALVLCSTARRAQDTLEPVRARLPRSTEVRLEDELYGASAPELLARLQVVADEVPSVMVVGHNPGLEDLVRGLGPHGDAGVIARVHAKFPTAALATLAFDGSWQQLGSGGSVRLESFVVPGDLE